MIKNSPQGSSRYESDAGTPRGPRVLRIYTAGSAFSLSRRHAFRVLSFAPVPLVHARALGQAHHAILVEASDAEARSNRMLPKLRPRLPRVRAKALSPAWTRKPSQPTRTRNRVRATPHRHV